MQKTETIKQSLRVIAVDHESNPKKYKVVPKEWGNQMGKISVNESMLN